MENSFHRDPRIVENPPGRLALLWKTVVENSVENVYNLLYLKLSGSLCELMEIPVRKTPVLVRVRNLPVPTGNRKISRKKDFLIFPFPGKNMIKTGISIAEKGV